MKHRVTKSKKAERELAVEISRETVTGEIGRVCREVAKRAKIRGYRPGKAPLGMVRKHYGPDITDEAMRNLVSGSLSKAITESRFSIVGDPAISDVNFDEQKGMSYKATVNLMPEVSVKRYKGLKLKRQRKQVSEKEIGDSLKYFQESNASYRTREGASRKGDYVICDLDCRVGEEPVEKKQNIWLAVEEDAFIPWDAIRDAKAGDVRRAEKDLPADYSRSELAGKKAVFEITVKEVKERVIPELTDELAKGIAGVAGIEELKEAIRKNLEANAEREAKHDLERQALEMLIKENRFDVPEFMVERRLEQLVSETRKRLAQGRAKEEIGKKEGELRERFRRDAENQVRIYFLLNRIAEDEGIKISDEDYDRVFEDMAASSRQTVGQLKKYYEEHGLVENLGDRLRSGRAIDIILASADISTG